MLEIGQPFSQSLAFNLFGKKTEKRRRKLKDPNTGEDGGGNESDGHPGNGDGASAKASHGPPSDSNTDGRRGHGRRAAADYRGAATVFCPHSAHARASAASTAGEAGITG